MIASKAGEGESFKDSWPQTAEGYELIKQIGQGAFAKVWQAKCPEMQCDVAVKIMELDNLTSSLEDIYQEVRVMLLSKHPGVLEAHACFVVKRSLWLVMPLMRKGSCLRIMKYLKKAGYGDGMKEECIATILKATLEGLEYFHKQGQVHRDIKASNLLMDSDGTVKISDFGVAGWLPSSNAERKDGEQRRTFVGTPCWMAPEVMEQAQGYDEKADIWSFGITALELAKGFAPYAKMQPMKVLLMTIQNPPPSLKTYEDYASTKSKFSRHFKEMVQLCLQKNPQQRPSASALLQKTFFKKAQPKLILVKEMLERVPIPDTIDDSASLYFEGADEELEIIKKEQQEEIEKIKQKEQEVESPPTAVDKPTNNKIQEKLLNVAPRESFVRGSTWVFDDDDEDDSNAKAARAALESTKQGGNAGAELSEFDMFAAEFANAGITGEDTNTVKKTSL